MGVRCVIDDIGRAGRIEDLARLEVDAIELGRRHVHQIDTDQGRVAASVLALAGVLGIETVAEGIESTDQLEFVRDRGCTAAQGFLLARPAVGEEIEHLLGLRFDDIGGADEPVAINPVA
jgi:EAL domain-containing protein (putative c-di-GMP-specific phosphodiesterase class I)